MRLRDIIARRPRAEKVPRRDWTNSWSTRDWADLPVYHPRRDDNAAR